ncbi:MAG: hypothetical protein ACK5LN_12120 [Propioniciclava sp.]
MALTPWTDVLAKVDLLNDPQTPFSYTVEGDRIVGSWDSAKIGLLGLTGTSGRDDIYRIEIRQVSAGIFALTEPRRTKAGPGPATEPPESDASAGDDTSHGEPAKVVGGRFHPEDIKRPILDYLERRGWSQKKGFFSRLFG